MTSNRNNIKKKWLSSNIHCSDSLAGHVYNSITLFLSILINQNTLKVFRDDYQKYIIIVHKKQHLQSLNFRVIGIGIST